MKTGFDGGSQTYQRIQIPLLMPSRYERDTADRRERIYEERERAATRPDIRAYETSFCWQERPYWLITIRSQRVISVNNRGHSRGVRHSFRAWYHKGNVKREDLKERSSFTCSEVHLQQDTQLVCPERLSPSGALVWPGVDLGGAALINHSVSIG